MNRGRGRGRGTNPKTYPKEFREKQIAKEKRDRERELEKLKQRKQESLERELEYTVKQREYFNEILAELNRKKPLARRRSQKELIEREINEIQNKKKELVHKRKKIKKDLQAFILVGTADRADPDEEPDLSAEETDQEDYKHSVFFITINTNQKPMTEGDGWFRQLVLLKAIDYTFCTGTEVPDSTEEWKYRLGQLLDFLSVNARTVRENDGSQDTIHTAHIKQIEVEKSIEIGKSSRGRLHAHVIVRITHNTKIHLNKPNMKRLLLVYLREIGVTNPYVHIDALGDTMRSLREYLKKDNEEEEETLDSLFEK